MELLNRFLGMVQLKKKPYQEASKEGFSVVAVNFLIAAVASALGTFFLTWDVFGLIGGIVFGWVGLVIGFAIGVLIVWGFSRLRRTLHERKLPITMGSTINHTNYWTIYFHDWRTMGNCYAHSTNTKHP